MQNHLETSTNRGNNASFTGMLSTGSDPCFGGGGSGQGHGGAPPEHHDFTTLNGSPNGQDYSHLINTNSLSHHHHPTQQTHHHIHSNHHLTETNNNNTNTTNHNNNTPSSKPKKPPPPNGKKTKGRVKIKMEFIDNKLRRYTTFSKRKTGIMKKAYELSTLTGTQVMLLVASETGHVYTFATRKLQPMITSEAGKALIQTCLNSPDPPNSGDTQRMSATGYEETELTYAADPSVSDHVDTKDDDSESDSSDGDEPKDIPASLLPLGNGLLPPNFAALFASAASAASAAGFSGASKTSSTLSIDLVSPSQDGSTLCSNGGNSTTSNTVISPVTVSSNRSNSTSSSSTAATNVIGVYQQQQQHHLLQQNNESSSSGSSLSLTTSGSSSTSTKSNTRSNISNNFNARLSSKSIRIKKEVLH